MLSTNEIKAQLVKTLKDSMAELQKDQEHDRQAADPDNTVIRISDGLYLHQKGRTFTPTSISNCSRYTQQKAIELASALPSSPGWEPTPVNLYVARDRELYALSAVLNTIEANGVTLL